SRSVLNHLFSLNERPAALSTFANLDQAVSSDRWTAATAIFGARTRTAPRPALIGHVHEHKRPAHPARRRGRLHARYRGTPAGVADAMQRVPVFVFDDALAAREFGEWVEQHEPGIRSAAEATTRSGKLTYIGQYQVGPLCYLRVNYTTGDAAGQNMTARATLAACEWIKANYPGEAEYVLSGAIDTDKKHSQINMLLTRGKR